MAVKLYTFVVRIDGSRYAGHVPATSFEAAAKLVPNGTEWGELIEEGPIGAICAICARPVSVDMTHPQPVEEWAEVLEEKC